MSYALSGLSKTVITSAEGGYDWRGRPVLADCGAGIWAMAYYRADAHSDTTGDLCIRFTDDDGLTWSDENTYIGGAAVTGFPMRPTGVTESEGPQEPRLYTAPNGTLILHMWHCGTPGTTFNGAQQSVSTDGGQTWSTPAPVIIDDMTEAEYELTIASDDYYIEAGVLYAGFRQFSDATQTSRRAGIVSTDDNGATWTLVGYATELGDALTEPGFKKNSAGDIIMILRYMTGSLIPKRVISSDAGATWTEPVHVNLPASGRHRIFRIKDLTGGVEADDLWLMCGFVIVSGDRIPAVWVSDSGGLDWTGPLVLDTITDDAGYMDILYDTEAGEFVCVGYYGATSAAEIVMYRFGITGITDA